MKQTTKHVKFQLYWMEGRKNQPGRRMLLNADNSSLAQLASLIKGGIIKMALDLSQHAIHNPSVLVHTR